MYVHPTYFRAEPLTAAPLFKPDHGFSIVPLKDKPANQLEQLSAGLKRLFNEATDKSGELLEAFANGIKDDGKNLTHLMGKLHSINQLLIDASNPGRLTSLAMWIYNLFASCFGWEEWEIPFYHLLFGHDLYEIENAIIGRVHERVLGNELERRLATLPTEVNVKQACKDTLATLGLAVGMNDSVITIQSDGEGLPKYMYRFAEHASTAKRIGTEPTTIGFGEFTLFSQFPLCGSELDISLSDPLLVLTVCESSKDDEPFKLKINTANDKMSDIFHKKLGLVQA